MAFRGRNFRYRAIFNRVAAMRKILITVLAACIGLAARQLRRVRAVFSHGVVIAILADELFVGEPKAISAGREPSSFIRKRTVISYASDVHFQRPTGWFGQMMQ